jgi:hypothetical protein
MSAKIFGIGLPKTGTRSLHAALKLLGYRSVHYPVTWEEIDSHEAAAGMSIACWFEELDKLYPGSKYILTVRDLNPWLQSCEYHYGQRISPDELSPQLSEVILGFMQKAYGTTSYEPALFQDAYSRHIQHVQNYFAHRPQDLLIMNTGGGKEWEQLCPFIEKHLPDVPFPHQNKKCESLPLIRQQISSKIEHNAGDLLN